MVGTISTDKALALDISALPTDQGVTVLVVGTAMVVISANLFVTTSNSSQLLDLPLRRAFLRAAAPKSGGTGE
jgi:hypothetical protein